MYFDIDMTHILHTRIIGKKRVLLFPDAEQYKLYRKTLKLLTVADYPYNYESFDCDGFPAARLV